jgi:Mrp family chromosome partitioning ATPase
VQIVWSVKGGVGVTVVAAALAAGWSRRGEETLLVDLCGDGPAVLGLPEPSGPGVLDWLGTSTAAADALDRLVIAAGEGLSLLPRGTHAAATWPPARSAELARFLTGRRTKVVVDAGVCGGAATGAAHAELVAELGRSGRSLLVMRPCYLALRRAVAAHVAADGVVLVREPGRSLDRRDVADVLSLPVLAQVDVDPALARSVDAGLLARRAHRLLDRPLRELW